MTDKLLLDTNAVIYALQGALHINELLERRNLHLSFITEIELYSWPVLKPDDSAINKEFYFLVSNFGVFISPKEAGN